MNTTIIKGDAKTVVEGEDRVRLQRILDQLGPHAQVPPIGRYSTMSRDDVWLKLVGQVCVMGSARGMDALIHDQARFARFAEAASLRTWGRHGYRAPHLAKILSEFGATRFPTKAAKKLKDMTRTATVVRDGGCVLLDGLAHQQPADQVREALVDRCPIMKLKSASDFMITVGLSQDVIALDVRIVGALRKYVGFNLTAGRVQGKRNVYLSVEQALREVCAEAGKPLALLDRTIFQFIGMTALDFALGRRAT